MSSTHDERPRRSSLFGVFAGFGFGLLFLAMGFNRPTIADMRTVDLVHLLGTGACLGVGIVALALYFLGRRPG